MFLIFLGAVAMSNGVSYKDDYVSIYNGDCLEFLRQQPDESVDLVITSPPYCMNRAYENPEDDVNTFKEKHEIIFEELYRVVKPGGSICWQVGYHVSKSCVIPLDFIIYEIFSRLSKTKKYPLILRNRIIWTFGHGLNSTNRFSGRHEVILWFTKGNGKVFNLDVVRVPQKYPGKKYYKGPHKGEYSGNPLGKNPSDVWDIPNVKANHVEKTAHPCQFPVAIPRRLIKALSNPGDVVLDMFLGSGSTAVASILEKRYFIGAEIQPSYFEIAKERILESENGTIKVREDKPIEKPNLKLAVSKLPETFKVLRKGKEYE